MATKPTAAEARRMLETAITRLEGACLAYEGHAEARALVDREIAKFAQAVRAESVGPAMAELEAGMSKGFGSFLAAARVAIDLLRKAGTP